MERPSEVVARRVKAECERQHITVARLAERCAEIGMPRLTRDAIASIISGRRRVDVDELYTLGAALKIPPTLLTVPLGTAQRFAIAPELRVHPLLALEWLQGQGPLLDSRHRPFTRWRDEGAPEWNEAAAPIWFYERLRELEGALRDADDKKAALDALREHVELMTRVGLDESRRMAEYEKHYGEER